MRKFIICIVFIQILIAGSLFSQEFLRSKGLQLFNETQYSVALDSMESWLVDHKSEFGLVKYFMGESYYHLCFSENDITGIRQHLDLAIANFTEALNASDINTRFIEKLPVIQYKLGWCYFRKAELSLNPLKDLKRANQFFSQVNNDTSDELEQFRLTMQSISALKTVQYNHYLIWQTENKGYANNLRNESLALLRRAEGQLESVVNHASVNHILFNALQYTIQEIQLLKVLIYLTATHDQFRTIQDPSKQSSLSETVQSIFNQQNFSELTQQYRQPSSDYFQRLTLYLQARQLLLQYLISDDLKYYQDLIETSENWSTGFLQSEKQLIEGIRDFNLPATDNRFRNLYANRNSSLYKASQVQAEVYYWLGWISFLVNPSTADRQFEQFLNKSQNRVDFRMQLLREDAKLRQLQIRFDSYVNHRSHLRKLKKEVENFAPSSSSIDIERKQLYQMIRIGLGDKIWSEVLESRNANERLDEAIQLIQAFMLRATQVTGKDRELYLKNLTDLFEITASKRIQQTTFYRGMTLFLQAEIQENQSGKRRIYQKAADALKESSGIYIDEAQYIQGRSLFAAIKHIDNESQQSEYIENAKQIFIRLINEKQSLRSLYYLAEIYRIEGNHLAAIACYDQVIASTNGDPDGLFWNKNAIAAKQNCQNQGNARVLDSIMIQNVEKLDYLLVIDDQVVSLEKFADREYLMRKNKQQAIDTWIHLGHPVLSVYPSINQLTASYFKLNSFETQTIEIQERLGKVTAGIRFEIDSDIPADSIVVFINDEETIAHPSGYYEKSPLPIYNDVVIRVQIPGYYLYEKQMNVNQPGIQKFIIAPVQKSEITEVSIDSSHMAIQVFDQRPDNFVMNMHHGMHIHKNSILYETFIQNIKLRDIIYSESYHGFLVPNSEGIIEFYKNDPMLTPDEPIELDLPDNLPGFSPESMVTDSKGNLYITDWKNHRIVVFNRLGDYVRMMGDYGVNDPGDPETQIQLQYPTRIMMIESNGYMTNDGFPVYRSDLFFVCDANGVHMTDENGNYLETVVSNEIGVTDYTLLSIDKKDMTTKVNVFNRLTQNISCYLIR